MDLLKELKTLNTEKKLQDEKDKNDRELQEVLRLEKIFTDATDNLEDKLKRDAKEGKTERLIVSMKQADAIKPFVKVNNVSLDYTMEYHLTQCHYTFKDIMEQDGFTDLFIGIFKAVKDLGLTPTIQISNNGFDSFISIKVDWSN